jgi:hypothetical protein
MVSRLYIGLLNLTFGYKLHHYNESVLHRTRTVRSLVLRSDSYAVPAEALIKSLRGGCTYVETPIRNLYPPGTGTRTKAFRVGNVVGVAKFFLRTLWDVYIGGNYRKDPACASQTERS